MCAAFRDTLLVDFKTVQQTLQIIDTANRFISFSCEDDNSRDTVFCRFLPMQRIPKNVAIKTTRNQEQRLYPRFFPCLLLATTAVTGSYFGSNFFENCRSKRAIGKLSCYTEHMKEISPKKNSLWRFGADFYPGNMPEQIVAPE